MLCIFLYFVLLCFLCICVFVLFGFVILCFCVCQGEGRGGWCWANLSKLMGVWGASGRNLYSGEFTKIRKAGKHKRSWNFPISTVYGSI